jgi:hypothetical protein
MSHHSRYQPINIRVSDGKEYHMNISKELSGFDFKNFDLSIHLKGED